MTKLQTQQILQALALTFLWTAALFLTVSLAGVVLLLAAKSSLPAPLVAALLTAIGFLTILRQQSRDRARRQRAALDAYVARELTRQALYRGNDRFGLAPAPVYHEH